MEIFRRVLGGVRHARGAEVPLALSDSGAAADSRRPETLLAALDIDAAINAHERWKDRLMDYLEGRTTYGVDPALVRRDTHSALGRWLHGVGGELLGDQPAFALLLARHRYFHEQAASLVELAQHGEWDKAVQVLNGGYRYGSSQVVLLLKELKRGLSQG
ncbi:CZB domain-containing protein [Acidovorax sp.]|uniref:CZB domain-containing protein n=1 Tax=Acidovorax sp. TaxID=1872122 RepID=UPI0039188558